MSHSATYIDPALPLSIARVAGVTGNPLLDTMSQCCDVRPYFAFYTTGSSVPVYTLRHPSTAGAASVPVYMSTTSRVDGETYTAMEMKGRGTQTGATLVYSGETYTNNGGYANVRLHLVNKWAKYKPQLLEQMSDITDAQRAQGPYPYGLRASAINYFSSIHDSNYAYVGLPGHFVGQSGYNCCRLTDFSGYNELARPDVRGTLSLSGTMINCGFTEDIGEVTGAVQLTELVSALSGKALTDFYPCVLVSRQDSSQHYARALLGDGAVRKYAVTVNNWGADLSTCPVYAAGTVWKISVFFASAVSSGSVNLNGWQDVDGVAVPSAMSVFACPDTVSLEFEAGYSMPRAECVSISPGLRPVEGDPSSYVLRFEWPEGYDEDAQYYADVNGGSGPEGGGSIDPGDGTATWKGLTMEIAPMRNVSTGEYEDWITRSISSQYVLVTVPGAANRTAHCTVQCRAVKNGQTARFASKRVTCDI